MSRFLGRRLWALSVLIVLSACQNSTYDVNEPAIDEFVEAELLFDTHLANQQLREAGQQLDALHHNDPDQPHLPDLQHRLANAWLAVGEQALQSDDIDTASAALIEAKRLLPQAPALTEGLTAALAAVNTTVEPPVVKLPVPVKPTLVRKVTVPSKPIAAERVEPAIIDTNANAEPVAVTQPLPTRRQGKARIIDVNAPSTSVPIPKGRNDHQLGRLLDDVAADVVKFRASVSIEVADTRDFHWVAALLSARIKKLDANFKPRLHEVIHSIEPAQLIITPNTSL